MSYLSGWLTAFCFWRNDGTPMFYQIVPKFDQPYAPVNTGNIRLGKYQLDGIVYHTIDTHDIPSGFASVPVKVDDGRVYRTKMVAGSLGINVTKSGERDDYGEEKWDSVSSLGGWLMYLLEEEEASQVEDEKDMPKVWEMRYLDEEYL
jgi:hypothetical protein